MRPSAHHAIAIVLVGATSLVACGGDDGASQVSAEEQPYVEAVSKSLAASEEDDIELSEEQRDCFAARYVDIVGVDELAAAGVDPEKAVDDPLSNIELTDERGGQVYDSFGDCDIDLRGQITEAIASDKDLTDEQKACFDNALSEENLRKMVTFGFGTSSNGDSEAGLDDPEAMEVLAPIMACAFMGLDDATTN